MTVAASKAERLAGLYGLPARLLEDPNLVILMRHRAVLFGLLGGFLLLAAFRPNLQAIALVMGFASVLSFLGLAWSAGPHNAAIGRVVTADLIEQMNASSATVPASVSEFDETSITPVQGMWVNAPYVGEAHVTSECRVLQTIPLGNTTLVIGEILGFHMSETWDAKDGVPAHVGRLSSTNYILTSGEQVSLPRPE